MTSRAHRFVLALISPVFGVLACGQLATPAPSEDGALGTTSEARSPLIAEAEAYTGSDLPNKQLVLTFDDGPGPDGVTGNLARWLAARAVPIKATFFVNGACIATTTLDNNSCGTPTPGATTVLATIKANGHTVGNHTTTHRDMADGVPNAERVQELFDTHTLIQPYQVWSRWFFRAPFGSWSASAFTTVAANATMNRYIGPIYWGIGGTDDGTRTPDWKCWELGYSTRTCGDQYLAEIRAASKGIVLMHDPYGDTDNHDLDVGQGNTVDMVKYIIGELDKEGGWTYKGLDEVPSIAAALPKCNAACVTCTGPAANQCASCPAGKYPLAGTCTACTACPAGKYTSTSCTATANTVCTACDPSCATCSGAGPSECISCAPGKHVAAGKCVDDTCSSCPAGHYIATECTATTDTVCAPCAANTFSDAPNAASCAPCAAGTLSGPGSSQCTECATCGDAGASGGTSGGASSGGTEDAAPPGALAENDGQDGCSVGSAGHVRGVAGGVMVGVALLLASRRRGRVSRSPSRRRYLPAIDAPSKSAVVDEVARYGHPLGDDRVNAPPEAGK